MPSKLRRYQQTRDLHFVTFSCYRRRPKLGTASARAVFEHALEKTRRTYGLCVTGYVVMSEHVHLLVSEPGAASLATALQALKQSVSRTLALRHAEAFWQARYYDFNAWSERKRIEKLRYTHRNPAVRGLVSKPEDWAWSSFRHYATGAEGVVEIESEWTARRRELMGIRPKIRFQPVVHSGKACYCGFIGFFGAAELQACRTGRRDQNSPRERTMATQLSPEQMKQIVRSHFEDFVNQRKPEVIRTNMTADFLDHDGPGGKPTDVSGDETMMRGMYAAMPDLHLSIEDVVAEGDRVVCRNIWRWTDKGSGKNMQFHGFVMWRFEGPRIAERWATVTAPAEGTDWTRS